MNIKKYQSPLIVVFGALLMTTSCDKNADLVKPANSSSASQTSGKNSADRIANYTLDGTEGDPISLDVATRWIANYTNQNGGKVTGQFFGARALQKMLSQNGSMGIRFYYSLDGSNNSVVVATAANGTGQDFSSSFKTKARNSSIAFDATSSTLTAMSTTDTDSVSTDVSTNWKGNYVQANPSGIQAHFFGYQLITQILSQTGCIGIRCYYALNDSGVQQLLLVGVTNNGQNILPQSLSAGRTTGGDGTVGDMSLPCPTYCSGT
jgi:hypothetical protein